MAGSNVMTGGGDIPGLQLRAWALVNGGAGTLIKGSNIASLLRNSAGNYTLTYAVAAPDSNAVLVIKSTATNAGAFPAAAHIQGISAAGVTYQTPIGGVTADPAGVHWVGVYG